MGYENLIVEKRGPVALVTVNRPDKLNALNVRTREEILAAFKDLREDQDVRVVVITGAGEKAFIAGADISEFTGKTPLEEREIMQKSRAFDAMEDFPKPVIAMINGYALGEDANSPWHATSASPPQRRNSDNPRSNSASSPVAEARSAWLASSEKARRWS